MNFLALAEQLCIRTPLIKLCLAFEEISYCNIFPFLEHYIAAVLMLNGVVVVIEIFWGVPKRCYFWSVVKLSKSAIAPPTSIDVAAMASLPSKSIGHTGGD